MRTKLYGKKIPFIPKWEYKLFVDDVLYDTMVSTRKLTAEEMVSIEAGYFDGLIGYGV